MSFKSKAQREKFLELVKQGKISKEKFDKLDSKTTSNNLPDRVQPKARGLVIGERRTRRIVK